MRVSQVENSGVAAEVGQRTERLDERRLHQILDVRARAHHPAHDAVHGADVGLKQVAKRVGIAPPRAVDQGRHLGRRWTRRVRHGPHTLHSGRDRRFG